MRLFCKTLILFPLFLFSKSLDIESLPWIQEEDSNAAYLAQSFLPDNPVILEAGVCNAEDTLRFKKIWPESLIYGFEAHPLHYQRSCIRLENTRGVKMYKMALFNRTGKTQFFLSKKIPGASSIMKDKLNEVEWPFDSPRPSPEVLCYQDEPIEVDCITLDEWGMNAKVTKLDYIWLDAEGAELHILQSAKTLLPTVSVITTEVNFQEFRKGMTMFEKLYDFLTENGFVLKYIWGNPKWQGVAMFINPKNCEKHLQNYHSTYLEKKFVDKIDSSKIKTILEIGSHHGKDAIKLANFYKCPVFAFEASPLNIKEIKKTIERYSNVHLIEKAVWNYSGSIPFYHCDNHPGSSSCFTFDYPSLAQREKRDLDDALKKYHLTEYIVPAIRLDEWMEENNIESVDLICMDLQGAELAALKSLGDYLATVRYVITEVEYEEIYEGQNLFPEIFQFMKKQGFTCYFQLKEKGLFNDILFVNNRVNPTKKTRGQRGRRGKCPSGKK